MQPESLKLTTKQKREISVRNSLTTAAHLSTVEGEASPSNGAKVQGSPTNNSQQKGVLANYSTVDEENSSENSQYQLVIYNPSANGAIKTDAVPNPVGHQPLSSTRQHPRVYPSVKAFTVQCANCFKWRIIPTKEKYEEIREHILEVPFFCKTGREWRPDISCDDPPDITQDGSRLWAIDKPNISLPPPGWQRLLRFRCEGSSKFADVYYIAPSGKKRLRSMVEVASFLNEHPEYVKHGADLSRFSFRTPKLLRDNSVPKRPVLAAPTTSDVSDHRILKLAPPSEGFHVNVDLQLSSPGYPDCPGSVLEIQTSKKKRHRLNRGAAPGSSLETRLPKKKRLHLNGGAARGFDS
ncbi:hypothetical protein ACS0TY_032894 [Phlomoides rotata]